MNKIFVMRNFSFACFVFCLAAFFQGCQKEVSFEQPNTLAKGRLQSDATGDCLPKVVNGSYAVGQALNASNTITVTVNVTQPGNYRIFTDTVNGYFFRATGIFTTTGTQTVTLVGGGTPFAPGINNFVVAFDSSFCDIQITVTSPGVGTLGGAPNACTPITVNGVYSPSAVMNSSNNAVVTVNVTNAGGFIITTDTVAGIWFSFSGNLNAGAQSVTLQANGTIPAGTTSGNRTFTVRLGSSRCTFVVNIQAPGSGTLDCTNPVFAGTYTAGVAMNSSNTVQLGVNVNSAGAYSIRTDTVNGVWFTGSGNFTTTGPTTVTLTANGTPTNPGTFTYTVRWGTSSCTFTRTFNTQVSDYFPRTVNSNWSYEIDDDATDSLYRYVIPQTLTITSGTYAIFMENDGSGADSSGYYRKSGSDYFEWLGFDNGLGNTIWLDYIFLKDNVAAGSPAWKSNPITISIGGTPFTIRFSHQVTQKDISVTLNTSLGSQTYNNVIVVEERIEAQLAPGVWQDLSSTLGYLRSFYARNIGLIQQLGLDGSNNIDYKLELRRYQVF
ncbi:MAG: hypothetical protein N2747_06010 [Chitinophagaceae bacterium]|nr:hypothetical protein [Chitinophagaceae bacterium]